MNVLPVISRELRDQARQQFTFTLRELGVMALLFAGLVFALGHPFAPSLGSALFRYMHLTLFIAIWILVPLSAADCISRERREGTLGLLLLTPLSPSDIVIAKGVTHGLRAATLLVAVLPVLAIPFLLGGVNWQQAGVSALVNVSAVCWALAAALLASAGTRSGLRAMVGALVLSLLGFIVLVYLFGACVEQTFSRWLDDTWLLGLWLAATGAADWQRLVAVSGFTSSQILAGAAGLTALSFLALGAGASAAALQIRRTWRDEPPPPWVQKVRKIFCTPVLWVNFLRRWMRWKLQRNPIGWLEQRTWTGRLVTWAWFAVIVSIYSAVFTDRNFFRNYNFTQTVMGWLLMGSIAASAAGSFRRERETGVLELLLVSPLSSRQIIEARLRGLWGQFLPALALLLGIWLYLDSIFKTTNAFGPALFFGITFLTLPVIGLYFSVRSKSFLAAFLQTLIVGLVIPMVVNLLFGVVLSGFISGPYFQFSGFAYLKYPPLFLAHPCLWQLAFAWVCVRKLYRCLERRDFPLERMAT